MRRDSKNVKNRTFARKPNRCAMLYKVK